MFKVYRRGGIVQEESMRKPLRVTKTGEGISEVAMGMTHFLLYAYDAVVSLYVGINAPVTLNISVVVAYDFQDSSEKHFNVLALYNSTYQNISYVPMPFGLLRVSHSLNAVGAMYFIDNSIDLLLLILL